MSSLWRKRRAVLALLSIATLLAVGNLWVAAQRSTIPIRLDEQVVRQETRREKHPDRDDVHCLYCESGRSRHVDRGVFDAVEPQQQIRKAGWAKELADDGQAVRLNWSADTRGMTRAMPLLLATFVAVTIAAARARR